MSSFLSNLVSFSVFYVVSLTRQWTMEDEEEVEREKRRRVRGSSSTADPEADFSQSPRDMPASGSTFEMGFTSTESQGLSR